MRTYLPVMLALSLILTSCATGVIDQRRAEEIAIQASLAFQNQDYQEASLLYAQAVPLDPKNASYQYNEQLALYQNKAYEQVIQQSENSFEAFPTHLEFLFLQAKAYSSNKQYDVAILTYEKIFTLNPALYEQKVEVAELEITWGYQEKAKKIALSLLDDHQQVEKALDILTRLEGDASWYAHMQTYLTMEAEVQAQEQLQEGSNTVDESSSVEESAQPTQDTQ